MVTKTIVLLVWLVGATVYSNFGLCCCCIIRSLSIMEARRRLAFIYFGPPKSVEKCSVGWKCPDPVLELSFGGQGELL